MLDYLDLLLGRPEFFTIQEFSVTLKAKGKPVKEQIPDAAPGMQTLLGSLTTALDAQDIKLQGA